jgi:hypothetical protein
MGKTIDNIDWDDVVKKEAKGSNNDKLGEVQEVLEYDVIIKVGMLDKETYCIPKSLVERFDGQNLWFRISKEKAKNQYRIDD